MIVDDLIKLIQCEPLKQLLNLFHLFTLSTFFFKKIQCLVRYAA